MSSKVDAMDRDMGTRKIPVESRSTQSDVFRSGLYSEEFSVSDPDFVKKLQRLTLDKYQSKSSASRSSQTLGGGPSSTLLENEALNVRVENVKRSLADKTYSRSRNIRKLGKATSQYFDRNSSCDTRSAEIKNAFSVLNRQLDQVTPDDYKIYVDCKQFADNEVKVRVEKGFLVVQARHQPNFDDHGLVIREFTRRWTIPEDVIPDKFSCILDNHKILIIKAPRKPTSLIIPVQIETPGLKTFEV